MGTKKALIVISTGYNKDFSEFLPDVNDSSVSETFAKPLTKELKQGGFSDVRLLEDEGCADLSTAILEFFASPAGEDDLLLVYFFGYGIVDNQRTLHLLTQDSRAYRRPDGSTKLQQCINLSQDVLREAGASSKPAKVVFMDALWGTTISDYDLKQGDAVQDKEDYCISLLKKTEKLSFIVTHEIFSANYYTLEHRSELQRSGFSSSFLQALQELRNSGTDGAAITVDAVYGKTVSQLKHFGCDYKPWKWDPGNAIGRTEFVRTIPKKLPVTRQKPGTQSSNGPAKLKSCFVISPLTGDKANWVFSNIIEPGCLRAGYKANRSDKKWTAEIMPDVLRELQESPMTVAYLGPTNGHWSANVMIEVGYRLATGRPIVPLREMPLPHEHIEPLPFDIKDRRTIFLPSKQGEEKQELEEAIESVAEYIRSLENTQDRGSLWNSDHPLAHLSFKIGKQNGTFLNSSPAADALFSKAGIENGLCSIELNNFIQSIHKAMSPSQGTAFLSEQNQLIGRFLAPAWQVANNDMPVATVPIIFSQDAEAKAYLPVIVEHSQQGDELFLKILYLDVSGKITESSWARRKIFICDLRGEIRNDDTLGSRPIYTSRREVDCVE